MISAIIEAERGTFVDSNILAKITVSPLVIAVVE
jgi:hypothetical protein